MTKTRALSCTLTACALLLAALKVQAAGDPDRGAKLYRICAGCHSLEPGRHRAGPSLARIFGRAAGTVAGFLRYSEALKESKVVWNEETLDAWLEEPDQVIPGNLMPFPGIKDAERRADLVAFLRKTSAKNESPNESPRARQESAQEPKLPGLEKPPKENQVTSVRYCRDSYFVTLATGQTVPYWAFNLRLKTDSNPETGPVKGQPVLIAVGMRGDRAALMFSSPEEISGAVERRCEQGHIALPRV